MNKMPIQFIFCVRGAFLMGWPGSLAGWSDGGWRAMIAHSLEMLVEMAFNTMAWRFSEFEWSIHIQALLLCVWIQLLCLKSTEQPQAIISFVFWWVSVAIGKHRDPRLRLWVSYLRDLCMSSSLGWLWARLPFAAHVSKGIIWWICLSVDWGVVPCGQTCDSVFSPPRTP